MKKSLSAALVLFIATTLINGCSVSVNDGTDKPTASDKPSTPAETQKAETDKSGELTVEKSVMAKENKEGKYAEVDPPTFKKGDTAAVVLVNVGKFTKDKDGKNSFDMDMELKDAQGKVLAENAELLKEEGTRVLENDTASNASASINTTKLDPGEYSFKVTIYDKIGKGKTSVTKTFKVE